MLPNLLLVCLLLLFSSPAAFGQQTTNATSEASSKTTAKTKSRTAAKSKRAKSSKVKSANTWQKRPDTEATSEKNLSKSSSAGSAMPSEAVITPELLETLDQVLPQKFIDKLPAMLKTELSTANTNKFEEINYWPGLNDKAHQLSLFTPPAKGKRFPLIIYVHGGAWLARPKSPPHWVSNFVRDGFAVATVHYRLLPEGIFPAQLEDLNTALRWLKANASRYNIDPDRIGLFGASAGGHLVSLMGTSWNNAAMDLGQGDKTISRQVQAVCDFCGPSNLLDLGSRMAPGQIWDTVSPTSAVSVLLGGPAPSQSERARQASAITYASASSPPFFIVHGGNDQIVPLSQSEELAAALKSAGAPVFLQVVPGAGHDIEKSGNVEAAKQFFKNYLKP